MAVNPYTPPEKNVSKYVDSWRQIFRVTKDKCWLWNMKWLSWNSNVHSCREVRGKKKQKNIFTKKEGMKCIIFIMIQHTTKGDLCLKPIALVSWGQLRSNWKRSKDTLLHSSAVQRTHTFLWTFLSAKLTHCLFLDCQRKLEYLEKPLPYSTESTWKLHKETLLPECSDS